MYPHIGGIYSVYYGHIDRRRIDAVDRDFIQSAVHCTPWTCLLLQCVLSFLDSVLFVFAALLQCPHRASLDIRLSCVLLRRPSLSVSFICVLTSLSLLPVYLFFFLLFDLSSFVDNSVLPSVEGNFKPPHLFFFCDSKSQSSMRHTLFFPEARFFMHL